MVHVVDPNTEFGAVAPGAVGQHVGIVEVDITFEVHIVARGRDLFEIIDYYEIEN